MEAASLVSWFSSHTSGAVECIHDFLFVYYPHIIYG